MDDVRLAYADPPVQCWHWADTPSKSARTVVDSIVRMPQFSHMPTTRYLMGRLGRMATRFCVCRFASAVRYEGSLRFGSCGTTHGVATASWAMPTAVSECGPLIPAESPMNRPLPGRAGALEHDRVRAATSPPLGWVREAAEAEPQCLLDEDEDPRRRYLVSGGDGRDAVILFGCERGRAAVVLLCSCGSIRSTLTGPYGATGTRVSGATARSEILYGSAVLREGTRQA
jgi:hypothetical protein